MTTLREAAQQALEAMDSKHDMTKAEWRVLHYRAFTDLRAALAADTRICTCHPDDNPPKPCQRKYAFSECQEAALAEDVAETNFGNIVQVVDSTEADDIPDATKMIEPVAYVTGFTKGRCTIALVAPAWIPPVGMALYRSPPNQSEDALGMVEPVAYIHETGFLVRNPTATLTAGIKLYAAPPKREPLTEEQIEFRFGKKPTRYMMFLIRSTERAHGIGGEE